MTAHTNGSNTVWKVVGPILAVTLLSIGGYMYVVMHSRVGILEERAIATTDRLARIEAKLDIVLEQLEEARKHLSLHDDATRPKK